MASFILSISLVALFSTYVNAAIFVVKNNCPYTVWAAASPGGGRRMNPYDTWVLNINPGQSGGRIWARTGCSETGPNGLSCNTGDCGGLLECQGYGSPPNTLAQYAINQWHNLDFFDISLVDGFNVPMSFLPTSNGCGGKGPTCTADLNGPCPGPLRANGGCHNPCTVFKTNKYCCNSGSCGPTNYSRYFKDRCPSSFSYPQDSAATSFTCPGGTNYQVTFCP